eukprot:2111641-Amphidinium_carterae.1
MSLSKRIHGLNAWAEAMCKWDGRCAWCKSELPQPQEHQCVRKMKSGLSFHEEQWRTSKLRIR